MRTHRVFMAPVTTPGVMTLQADVATWQALADQIEEREQAPLRRSVGPLELIRAAITTADGDTVRVTFPEQQARAVLRLAGVSA